MTTINQKALHSPATDEEDARVGREMFEEALEQSEQTDKRRLELAEFSFRQYAANMRLSRLPDISDEGRAAAIESAEGCLFQTRVYLDESISNAQASVEIRMLSCIRDNYWNALEREWTRAEIDEIGRDTEIEQRLFGGVM